MPPIGHVFGSGEEELGLAIERTETDGRLTSAAASSPDQWIRWKKATTAPFTVSILTCRCTRLIICDLLGIRCPILQGAMQGGGGIELLAAACEAGGFGVLTTFGSTNQKLVADIHAVRVRTIAPSGSMSCRWAAASASAALRRASSAACQSSPRAAPILAKDWCSG